MEALLPNLIQTAKTIAQQSLPEGSVSPELDAEMDEFVQKTTSSLLSGNSGGGGDNPLGNILGSLLGGGGDGGAGGGLGALFNSLGGLGNQTNQYNIYEYVEVEMSDFFKSTQHTVKFLAKYYDASTNAIRKKKKKVNVTLEPGSPEGHVIEIHGQGHYNPKTKQCGDVYITFRTRRSIWNDYYKRVNQDLQITLPIESFREDSFEFIRTLPHPSGRILKISKHASDVQKPFGIGGNNDIIISNFGFPRYEAGNIPCGKLVIKLTFHPQNYHYIPTTMDFIYNGETNKELVSKIPPRYITDANIVQIHISSNNPELSSSSFINLESTVRDSNDVVEELEEVDEDLSEEEVQRIEEVD
jgi:hypothetical protein